MRNARARPVGRLTKRAEFVAAASGRRFHTERMTVQGRLRPSDAAGAADDAGLRVGFTVTKRVGHATERNRIKRRLRVAALDACGPHADMALDMVVIARRDTLTAAYETLVADLARALTVVTRPKGHKAGKPPIPPTGDEGRGSPHV